jgi:cytochrome c biogenesis protein CcdA
VRRLLIVVLSIGFVDSVNPTTIGPALYLATQKNAQRKIAGFILGVFVVYLVGGLVLTLGPGALLIAALPRPGRQLVSVTELVLGLVSLAAAVVLALRRERIPRHLRKHESRFGRGGGSAILLGGGIMAIELPTAFPYFAVIAAIDSANVSVAKEIGLLILFNLLFVAPLLAILVVLRLSGERGVETLDAIHTQLHRRAQVLIPAVVGIVAVVLIVLGGTGLARA